MRQVLRWAIPMVVIFAICFCLFYNLGKMVLPPIPALQGEASDLAFVMSVTVTTVVMMAIHRARRGKD